MAANVKVDRSIWRPSPAPHTRARTHTRSRSVQQWQFMFIELMLICAPRHDFLMECNFVSGRAVHISDLLYRTQRHWITDCHNDWLTAWVIDWVNDWITARMSVCLSVCRFGPTGVHSIAISNAFMLAVCQKPKPERQPKKKEKIKVVCYSTIVASFVQFYCRQHTLRMRNVVCISSLNCGQLLGSSVTETNITNASFWLFAFIELHWLRECVCC